ncbi:unnamed protein product, partial [Mycena citricolor]
MTLLKYAGHHSLFAFVCSQLPERVVVPRAKASCTLPLESRSSAGTL